MLPEEREVLLGVVRLALDDGDAEESRGDVVRREERGEPGGGLLSALGVLPGLPPAGPRSGDTTGVASLRGLIYADYSSPEARDCATFMWRSHP
jgi:hypothetical protein